MPNHDKGDFFRGSLRFCEGRTHSPKPPASHPSTAVDTSPGSGIGLTAVQPILAILLMGLLLPAAAQENNPPIIRQVKSDYVGDVSGMEKDTTDLKIWKFDVSENYRNVATITASDTDPGDSITSYSLGGDYTHLYEITSAGVLTFKTPLDYENLPAGGVIIDRFTVFPVTVTVTSGAGGRELTDSIILQPKIRNQSGADEELSPPRNVMVTPLSGNRLLITWMLPAKTGPGITDYTIEYMASSTTSTASAPDDQNFYILSGLSPDTNYSIRIRAVFIVSAEGTENKRGTWSSLISGSTSSSTAPSKPAAPTLTAGSGQLTAEWAAPTNTGGSAITDYDLRYREKPASPDEYDIWTEILGSSDSTATSATIMGLTNGTEYEVQVRAENTNGAGLWSEAATGTPIVTAESLTYTAAPTTLTVGTAITALTATATNFTGTVGYSVTTGSLPDGLGINASTGEITGIPTTASTSTTTVTVTATAGTGTDMQTATANITFPAVGKGTLATPTNLALKSNSRTRTGFTVTFDAVSNAAGYTATARATGKTDVTVTLSTAPANPEAAFTGLEMGTTYAVTVVATGDANYADSNASEGLDVMTLANQVPTVANAIPDQEAVVGLSFSYTFESTSFNDADGDDLTYTATKGDDSALPSWLTFTNSSSTPRNFAGTPQSTDTGTLSVKVTASDGTDSITDTFDIVVSADTAPAFAGGTTISDQTWTVDTEITAVTLPAATGGNGTVSYELTPSLPTGVSLNGTTRVVSGTPTVAANQATYTWRAKDSDSNTANSDTAALTFALTVNKATLAKPTNLVLKANSKTRTGFTVSFNAVSNAAGYRATATPSSGTPVPVTLPTAPANPEAVFTGLEMNTTYTVTVVATGDANYADSNASDGLSVTTVANQVPAVANEILEQAATVGTAFEYVVPDNIFSDGDSDSLSYEAKQTDGATDSALPSWLTFTAAERKLAGTPQSGDIGTLMVKVIASDGNGGSVSDTFDIVVSAANSVPTVANAIPDQEAVVGLSFSYTFPSTSFNDADGDDLTYTATKADDTVLPSWLTFTNSSSTPRNFAGTPQSTDTGTLSVKVTASDGTASISDTFDIVVSADTAPAFAGSTTIPDQTWTVDTEITAVTLPAATGGNGTVSYELTPSLPTGVSLNGTTRVVSGTPTVAADQATYTWRAKDSDSNTANSDTAALSFALTVNKATLAKPTGLALKANSKTRTGFTVSFDAVSNAAGYTATARAAGKTPVPVTLPTAPANPEAVFTGLEMNTIYTVTVVATGNANYADSDASDGLSVTTLANQVPAVANEIPEQAATVGTAFEYVFPSNSFSDGDSDSLSYEAKQTDGATDSALPSWLTFTAAERKLAGTPQSGDIGTLMVKVIASDGNGGSVSDTFDIVVSAANSVPTIRTTIPDQEAVVGLSFSYTFPSTSFNDADGDDLTYTATKADDTALPSWLTFTNSSSTPRNFAGTPQSGDTGTLSVKVTASDGTASISDTFDIVVSADTAPAFAGGTTIPDQTWTVDTQITTLTLPAATGGNGTVSYELTPSLPTGVSLNETTRVVSGTPTVAADQATYTWRAKDSDSNTANTDTAALTFALTVNKATLAKPTNLEATSETRTGFTVTFDAVSNAAGYTATARAAGKTPVPVTLATAPANPEAVFTGLEMNTAYTVTVVATGNDNYADSDASDGLTVTTLANQVPTVGITIPDQAATVGTAFEYVFPSTSFRDADSDSLTYEAKQTDGTTDSELPSWLTFTAAERKLAGTPQAANIGTLMVKVIASDGNGGSVSDTFDIEVSATNSVPTVGTTIPDQEATVGTAFEYVFPSTSFSDADNDNLTYEAKQTDGTTDSELPPWLTFTAIERKLAGTPQAAHIGRLMVKVIASDGNGGSVSDTFNIEVSATNSVPTVGPTIPDQEAVVGLSFSYTFPSTSFSDADGDDLTYTATKADDTALPSWLTFTNSSSTPRNFAGTPQSGDTGRLSVKVTASDGTASISDTFDIVVSADTAPAFTGGTTIPDQTWTVDTQITALTLPAATGGNGTVSYELTPSLPTGVSLNETTRVVSGTPTVAAAQATYTWRAKDSDSNTANTDTAALTFALTVNKATLAKPTNLEATSETRTGFTVTFDAVSNAAGYTATATPSGGTAVTGTVIGTEATFTGLAANTTYTVTVVATGNANYADSDASDGLSVTTLANQVPTVGPTIPDQAAVVGLSFSYTFPSTSFSDADGDDLTYTATKPDDTALPSWLTFTNSSSTPRNFAGTPQSGDTGRLAVKVTASDGTASTSDTFDIVVSADTAPAFAGGTTIPDQTWTVDTQITALTLPAATGGNGTVSYELTPSLPTGVSLNETTRVVSGTPTVAAAQATYTWRAKDSDSNTANTDTAALTFALTVNKATLAQPTGLALKPDSTTTTGFAVTWDTVENATSYTAIAMRSDGTAMAVEGRVSMPSTGPEALFTGLTEGTPYTVSVVAISDANYSNSPPETLSVTTLADASLTEENLDKVNEEVLPSIINKIATRQVAIITDRLETVSSSSHMGSLTMEEVVTDVADYLLSYHQEIQANGFDWEQALSGNNVSFPLVNTGAPQTSMDDGESFSGSISFWGVIDHSYLQDKIETFDLDGDIISFNFGVDKQLTPDLVAGALLSIANSESEFTKSSIDSTYEVNIFMMNPYMSWEVSDDLSLWAMVGYGRGHTDLTEDSTNDSRRGNFTRFSAGGRFQLWQSEAGTELDLKLDATSAHFLEANVQNSRLAAELSRDFSMELGVLDTALELGLLMSSADEKSLAELVGRFHWESATGLSASAQSRVLLWGGNRKEWGIGGALYYATGGGGEGLMMSLEPSLGISNPQLLPDLWSVTTSNDLAITTEVPTARLNAEVAYGFPTSDGLLTPYTAVSFSKTTNTYGAGLRYGLPTGLDLDFKGMHKTNTTDNAENSILLELRSDL